MKAVVNVEEPLNLIINTVIKTDKTLKTIQHVENNTTILQFIQKFTFPSLLRRVKGPEAAIFKPQRVLKESKKRGPQSASIVLDTKG